MKKINEKEIPFRQGGNFGSKYLYKSKNNELGRIVIPPQTIYDEKNHYHKKLEEMFYFMKGEPLLLIGDKKIRVKEGDVYTVEPNEVHNLENDTEEEVWILFNKSPAIKGDRFEVD